MRSWRTLSLVPAFLLLLAACGGGGGRTAAPAPQNGIGGATAASAVEGFLRLANEKNYVQMGYLFGTREGPITRTEPARRVERRMYPIAELLANDRFVIRSESQIPGRGGEAVQVTAQITQRGQARDVPFVVVRSGDRWLVEQIDLERLTRTQ